MGGTFKVVSILERASNLYRGHKKLRTVEENLERVLYTQFMRSFAHNVHTCAHNFLSNKCGSFAVLTRPMCHHYFPFAYQTR